MSASRVSILLAGCGKMGGALCGSWLHMSSPPCHIVVVEPAAKLRISDSPRHLLQHVACVDDVAEDFAPDVIVLAVKPQGLDDVLPELGVRFGVGPLYLSIAAGKRLAYYLDRLGAAARVVRAMPNTPALVGMGMTTLCASPKATGEDRALATMLMEAAGATLWERDESRMDVITAISGSGPAYVFYFMECLMRAAIDGGLDERTARALVLHTIHGSSELAFCSEEPLDALRRNVASPGGTTEAALEILMNPSGMFPLIQEAVAAAIARAGELSGGVRGDGAPHNFA